MAAHGRVHHELSIALYPGRSVLEGRDRLQIQRTQEGPIELVLSPRVRVHRLAVDGRGHPFTIRDGILLLEPALRSSDFTLDVHYTGRFDDPAPVRPVNTDNPGYGVSGTITDAGTFLLAGAGWYPRVAGAPETIQLTVEAPRGTVAVTAGRLVAVTHDDHRTVSQWRVDHPLEGISLSAGPYIIDRRTEAELTVASFLLADNRDLASRYLDASLRYLRYYSDLFGPYPYETFAVVENFFPTGYGFPGYTLMGGVVLRLPFIPHTSLPHEIVHNWWGNGVQVDFATGNWCEGLATYSADYLLKEQASPEAAKDYRRQAMRNYASLVSASTDLPLNAFRSRTDAATKAVGYDKSAMVFHMLRQTVGEAAFWQSLRDLYAQYRFAPAGWVDLQRIFEHHAGASLETFFRQWIDRPGAPRLRLAEVRQDKGTDGYVITGRLTQEAPYYDVSLDMVLDTDGGPIQHSIRLDHLEAEFTIHSGDRPQQLVADPDYHLFRRLTRDEMPPTINSLRGSESVILVVADALGPSGTATAQRFAQAMGIAPVRIVAETDLKLPTDEGNDLIFIGLPASPQHRQLLPGEATLQRDGFTIEGQRLRDRSDVLFLVHRPPMHPQMSVALLHPLSPDASDPVIRKIPHYGRYSYLAFSDGRNRVKGTWEVADSPLMVRWDTSATSARGAHP